MGMVPSRSESGVSEAGADGGLAALRAGCRRACEAFVEAHYRGVHRFFTWLAGDPEAAEDLTQEAFAAFWESLADPKRAVPPDLKAWLYGIARNRWRKRCRDRHPEDASLDTALEVADGAPGPEAQALATLETEALLRGVTALPPDYREALALRVLEDLTYEQVAAALGIEPCLARWRVHQARQWLRDRLLAEGKEQAGATRA